MGRPATGNVTVQVRVSQDEFAFLTASGTRTAQAGLLACMRLAMASGEPPAAAEEPAVARKPRQRAAASPAVQEAVAALPPANRQGRWVCDRKDCARKPVNFGDTCTGCGKPCQRQ